MKALVTGGLGFIGSHLVDRLIDEGYDVTIIDDKSNSTTEAPSKCVTLCSSIMDTDFTAFLGYDIIFHLASVVGPAGVLEHGAIGPSIIENAKRVIDAALENQCPLIDISTSEIYGHLGDLNEDSDKVCSGPYQMRTEYGVAKLLAEIMIVNKAKTSELKYHIIRPFNVAGPRQRPDGGFVLPRFVISLLTGQPLTVFGDGLQVRAFTDVRDICDAIYKITASSYENEIWNIGNPANAMSILELAEEVINYRKKSDLVFIDPKKLHGPLFAEAKNKVAHIQKIQNLLGWTPKISLQQTIEDTINYYQKKIDEGYTFDLFRGKTIQELF